MAQARPHMYQKAKREGSNTIMFKKQLWRVQTRCQPVEVLKFGSPPRVGMPQGKWRRIIPVKERIGTSKCHMHIVKCPCLFLTTITIDCLSDYMHDYIFEGYSAVVTLGGKRVKIACVKTIDGRPGWVCRSDMGAHKTGPRDTNERIMTLTAVLKGIASKLQINAKHVHHPNHVCKARIT